MARCFVTRSLPGEALEALAADHYVDVWPQRLPPSPAQLRERAGGAEGLLTMLTDRVDADLLDACPGLKVVSNMAVGCDNVDVAAARERRIPVGHTPDVLTAATAELALTLMLALARRLPEAMQAVRTGEWGPWEPDWLLGRDLHGATLGIVGLGRIGQAVAQRARALDMSVIHAGRRDGLALEELLERSDFVSLHCPLTPDTRGLVGPEQLRLMGPTAHLVNTARGPIVDQDALATALRQGTIAGAALDVTDPEPLPPDHPLLEAPNLIVLPHIGSATRSTREAMADMAVANLRAGVEGRPLPHRYPG